LPHMGNGSVRSVHSPPNSKRRMQDKPSYRTA
jgi:hypothetical protein